MRYLSLFSGIEAASVAWRPLGWEPFAFAEIDPFACAVLQHHYPDVPNLGDVENYREWPDGPVDLVCGGSPCQSFSVAGLRAGMADPRGNLALVFLGVVDRYRPRWVVYENVPGLLSSNRGRDFGSFVGGLGELGYGVAWRILDAQHVRAHGFGRAVPQRRRRVFVVGYLGDWRRAAAVLFERESLSGNPAPRREAGERTAAPVTASAGGCSGKDNPGGRLTAFGGNRTSGPLDVATAVNAHGGPHGRLDFESETFVAHALRAEGFDASEDGTGRGTPLAPVCIHADTLARSGDANTPSPDAEGRVRLRPAGQGILEDGSAYSLTATQPHAIAFTCKDHGADASTGVSPTLRAMGHDGSHANAGGQVAVAVSLRGREGGGMIEMGDDCAMALRASQDGGDKPHALVNWAVRRLTPLECERLQGFPDGYTLVPYRGKPAADGPRYKALGNSWAVNCARWIGRRIEMVDEAVPVNPASPDLLCGAMGRG